MAKTAKSASTSKKRPIPEYELTSYEPVTITQPNFAVSDEDVDQKIAEMLENGPVEYEKANRHVAGVGDILRIGVSVDKDGEPVRALCHSTRIYELEKGYMPPSFDAAVKGMKVGETLEFDFMAPDYQSEAQEERPFHARVILHEILNEVHPELTDEWVLKYQAPCKTVDEFREQVRSQMLAESDSMGKLEVQQRAVIALSERFQGKIDDYWYDSTRKDLMKSYEDQAAAQGMTLAQMLSNQGVDEQQFGMMLMMQVRDMLVQGFCLDAWARHYKIKPTAKDVRNVADLMSNGKGEQIVADYKQRGDKEALEGLRVAARRYLANKNLVETATVRNQSN